MKQFTRNFSLGFFPIFAVVILTIYFTIIIIKYPLVGIEVTENNNQWIIENIYGSGWASSQPIEKGDILTLVNGKQPNEHSTVKWFNRVEMAKSITTIDGQSETKKFTISYSYLDSQYVVFLLLPFLFTITTILLSIYIYSKKKNDQSAIILIYFLLSIGVCYLSASVSSRGDVVGRISNILTLPLTLILFVHFLQSYFSRNNLIFIKNKSLQILYNLYLVFILLIASSLFFAKVNYYLTSIQLIFYLLLITYLFFHLIRFYLKNKNSDGKGVLKILGIILLIAFGPTLLFYAVPTVFNTNELIPAEITATFLIVIPIVFVYLQLAEKLFDIDFLLNRMRYYILLSLPFSIIIVFLLIPLLNLTILSNETLYIFILILIGTPLFLYVKAYKPQNELGQ